MAFGTPIIRRSGHQLAEAASQPHRKPARLRHFPDSEVVDPLAGFQLGSEPARRLASSCPGFRRPVGIAEFRNDRGIWTPPARRFRVARGFRALSFDTAFEFLQAIFEQTFLREQRRRKPRSYLFVECPQLIGGHRFKVITVHDRPQS